MSYNNGNYGNNYTYRKEESMWLPLGIIFTVIGTPVLLYWGHTLLKYLLIKHTWGEIVGMAVAGGVVAMAVSVIAYSIFAALWDWWDRQWNNWWGPEYTAPKNTYNTAQKDNNTSYIAPVKKNTIWGRNVLNKGGLLDSERERPPRATMFGRINGNPISADGMYEERYLNTYEYSHWLKQNERSVALRDGLVDETLDKGDILVETATKIDYT